MIAGLPKQEADAWTGNRDTGGGPGCMQRPALDIEERPQGAIGTRRAMRGTGMTEEGCGVPLQKHGNQ